MKTLAIINEIKKCNKFAHLSKNPNKRLHWFRKKSIMQIELLKRSDVKVIKEERGYALEFGPWRTHVPKEVLDKYPPHKIKRIKEGSSGI